MTAPPLVVAVQLTEEQMAAYERLDEAGREYVKAEIARALTASALQAFGLTVAKTPKVL